MRIAAVVAAVLMAVAGCSSRTDGSGSGSGCASVPSARATGHAALDRWIANRPMLVAHRGGDADWVEGTADAYRKAAAWNPQLALEVPIWLTSDGVWVVSHDATTGRVFDKNEDIRSSTWSTLSTLLTKKGGQRMARLVNDILIPYGATRVLFIDNKADAHADALFTLLDSYAGNTRYIAKGYYPAMKTATEARRRGYLTWGYYYDRDMGRFAATQSLFDILGLSYSAPGADFARMSATGKPVIAFDVANPSAASSARCKGASGLMVSGVIEVVHHH